MLTTRAVCEHLGVSRSTVLRMIADGRLPRPIKLAPGRSGSVRFPREAIEAAIAAMQVVQ